MYLKRRIVYLVQKLHEGLEILYPELGKYTGRSDQYFCFNEKAREFSSEFGFEPTEMDWVLSTGIKKARG